jgi:hypothetical protein
LIPTPYPQTIYVQQPVYIQAPPDPTATPAPTYTPYPTYTPFPTAVSTAVSTATATSSPTATPTSTPTATVVAHPTAAAADAAPEDAQSEPTIVRMSVVDGLVLALSTTVVGQAVATVADWHAETLHRFATPGDAGAPPPWLRTFASLAGVVTHTPTLREPESWQAFPPPTPDDGPDLADINRFEAGW